MREVSEEDFAELERRRVADRLRAAEVKAEEVAERRRNRVLQIVLLSLFAPMLGAGVGEMVSDTGKLVGAILVPLGYWWILIRDWRRRKRENPLAKWYDPF